MFRRTWLTSALVVIFSATLSHAASVEKRAETGPTADDIAKNTFNKTMMGVAKGTADMRMVIVDAQGAKKERKVSFKTMKSSDGLMRYLIKFESPADIKGTAFLVRERKGQLPDQYTYIPALKTSRRMAAGNASSSFFGTDFIYADLLPYPTDKKNDVVLKRAEDQKVGGQDAYVLEISPKVAESPYGKLKVYVQKDKFVTLQIEFFDKAGALLKVMRVRKLKAIEGQLTPVDIEMKAQSGSKTELFIENINPKAVLGEDNFTESAMMR
jgi:hypothetical protein